MKYVPAMRTSESSAVFGSPAVPPGLPAVTEKLHRDGDPLLFPWKQFWSGCSLKIYERTEKKWSAVASQLESSAGSWTDLDQLGEGLVDEDEGDEKGEDLLSEARNKPNQDASLQGHSDEDDQHQPEADPDPARQVLDLVVFAELQRNTERPSSRERPDSCGAKRFPQRRWE